jgi:hypothetical protein
MLPYGRSRSGGGPTVESPTPHFCTLSEAYRVLKPEGRLYVDSMNLNGRLVAIFLEVTRLDPRSRSLNVCMTATPDELEVYFRPAALSTFAYPRERCWSKLMAPRQRSESGSKVPRRHTAC